MDSGFYDPIPVPTHEEAVRFLQTGPDTDVEAHGRQIDYYLWVYGELEANIYEQIDTLKLECKQIEAPIIDSAKSRTNPATGKPFGDKHVEAEIHLQPKWVIKQQRIILLESKRRKIRAFLNALERKSDRLPGNQGLRNAVFRSQDRNV